MSTATEGDLVVNFLSGCTRVPEAVSPASVYVIFYESIKLLEPTFIYKKLDKNHLRFSINSSCSS